MATLTYQLVRQCLNNTNDAAGIWQIEAGQVFQGGTPAKPGKHVANYSSVKRTSCGTEQQNTAMLWLTLFFLGKAPPANITLHGSHDFHSGGEIGSVSAATAPFTSHIGKQFKRVVNTLTIS
jgi:hypothetical protein